ncbi:MAG: hypothetical protein QMB16_04690 [Paracoccaceae bacterium]
MDFFACRLVLRLRRGATPSPKTAPAYFRLAARLTHIVLYAAMFISLVSGAMA